MDTDEEDDHMHVPMEEVAENVMKGHSELTRGKSETDDLLLKSVSSNWSKTGRRRTGRSNSGTAVAAAQILTSISRGETFPMISPNNLTAVMDGQDQRLIDDTNSVKVEQPIENSSYNCSICDRSFATSRGLGIHRSNHNKDKKMTMKIKPRKSATKVLKADEDHESIHKTLVPVLDGGDGAMQSTAGPRTMEKKKFDLNQPCDMEDDDHQGKLHTQMRVDNKQESDQFEGFDHVRLLEEIRKTAAKGLTLAAASDSEIRKTAAKGLTLAKASDSGAGKYNCHICSKNFPSMVLLSAHFRAHLERCWRGIQPPPPSDDDPVDQKEDDDQGASQVKAGSSPGPREASQTGGPRTLMDFDFNEPYHDMEDDDDQGK